MIQSGNTMKTNIVHIIYSNGPVNPNIPFAIFTDEEKLEEYLEDNSSLMDAGYLKVNKNVEWDFNSEIPKSWMKT